MFKRLMALLWLRCQIIFSNKSILLQVLLPFGLTYFYKYLIDTQGMGKNKETLLMYLMICLPFSLTMAVGNPITVILSEEREKHNLSTLLLSGVKGYEYILSTLILPLVLTFIVIGVTPLILGVSIINTVDYIIVTFLTAVAIILFYLLLGLLVKTQVAAQVISVPALFIVAFLPMMANLDKTVAKITDYSFMGLFTKFFKKWEDFSWTKELLPSFTLLVWIISLGLLTIFIIKKRKTIQ
ncbi:ABC transporter permease [Streptococcus macacae]|uniref:Membrane protein n=1 Tax=Streptococcus macacae NCTC 11558 TaxID=764298 RepID=G5JW22_9STRE|nr:ABC transporter permease [Streptococcus macacae]EHJ52182.1 putative membrane protein [Streptococcus macacae NCTC 11558]SUN79356.1 ABC transporter permease subunit [Streptococcus macacae NCTC 11558]